MFEAVLVHTTGAVYRPAHGVGGDTRDVKPHCKTVADITLVRQR